MTALRAVAARSNWRCCSALIPRSYVSTACSWEAAPAGAAGWRPLSSTRAAAGFAAAFALGFAAAFAPGFLFEDLVASCRRPDDDARRAGLPAVFRFGWTRAAGFFLAAGRGDEVRRCLGMNWSTEKAAPGFRYVIGEANLTNGPDSVKPALRRILLAAPFRSFNRVLGILDRAVDLARTLAVAFGQSTYRLAPRQAVNGHLTENAQ